MPNEDYSNEYVERVSFFAYIFALVVVILIMSLIFTLFSIQRNKEIAHSNNYRQILKIAAEDCNLEIVEFLVNKVINIRDTKTKGLGVTLLQHAAKEGCLEVIKFLAEKKVDINVTRDKSRNTALHYAAEQGNLEIVKLLLQNGANPNAKEFRGKKPKDLAAIMSRHNKNSNKPYREIIDLLTEAEKSYKAEK